MSFLDDIVSLGSKAYEATSSSPIASSLVKTAALGIILNQVSKSMNKGNSKPDAAATSQPDRFVREQLSPDTNHSIPVVYGSAFIKGIITDAYLTPEKNVMWYCITICEKTGNLLSTGAPSVITFEDIYLNNCRLNFLSDGITVASATDDDGNVNTKVNGLIKVYCFNNGSTNPVVPVAYSNAGLANAYGLFPTWTTNHTMNGLVFALVRVEYDKENDVTGLGEIEFKLTNTLTQPGDAVYDYMTSTRYGAGINPTEIYSS